MGNDNVCARLREGWKVKCGAVTCRAHNRSAASRDACSLTDSACPDRSSRRSSHPPHLTHLMRTGHPDLAMGGDVGCVGALPHGPAAADGARGQCGRGTGAWTSYVLGLGAWGNDRQHGMVGCTYVGGACRSSHRVGDTTRQLASPDRPATPLRTHALPPLLPRCCCCRRTGPAVPAGGGAVPRHVRCGSGG